jgi:hypothetical protein
MKHYFMKDYELVISMYSRNQLHFFPSFLRCVATHSRQEHEIFTERPTFKMHTKYYKTFVLHACLPGQKRAILYQHNTMALQYSTVCCTLISAGCYLLFCRYVHKDDLSFSSKSRETRVVPACKPT